MADPKLTVHIAMLFGSFAVLAFLWTQAQRVGDWKSKIASRVLVGIATPLSIAWIYFGLLWIFQIDLRVVANRQPAAFWSLTGISLLVAVIVIVQSSRSGNAKSTRGPLAKYKIEVTMLDSEEQRQKAYDELVEQYIKEHPDPNIELQIRSNVMSRELAQHMVDWLRPRLASKGLHGPLRLVDLPPIPPPAAIRIRHSEGLTVARNDMEIDPGISGIDSEHSKGGDITDNKIRITRPPDDRGKT